MKGRQVVLGDSAVIFVSREHQATPTHRHFVVTTFQMNEMTSMAEATVVVGNVMVLDSKLVPQAIARGVPLSVILIRSVCPSTGDPERLDVIEVMAWASPVIDATFMLSVSIAGVAD